MQDRRCCSSDHAEHFSHEPHSLKALACLAAAPGFTASLHPLQWNAPRTATDPPHPLQPAFVPLTAEVPAACSSSLCIVNIRPKGEDEPQVGFALTIHE